MNMKGSFYFRDLWIGQVVPTALMVSLATAITDHAEHLTP